MGHQAIHCLSALESISAGVIVIGVGRIASVPLRERVLGFTFISEIVEPIYRIEFGANLQQLGREIDASIPESALRHLLRFVHLEMPDTVTARKVACAIFHRYALMNHVEHPKPIADCGFCTLRPKPPSLNP